MAIINGTENSDVFNGEDNPSSGDIFYLGGGNDSLQVHGNDTISGGSGNDYITSDNEYSGTNVSIFGEEGDDTISAGFISNSKIYGG